MDDFSLWDLMVSMFWFMLLVAWIWLLISILGDIFRDRELGGGAKAMWVLFLVFLPWLGALMYLIFRGNSMNERTQQAMAEAEKRQRAYIQSVGRIDSQRGGPDPGPVRAQGERPPHGRGVRAGQVQDPRLIVRRSGGRGT